MISDCYLLIGGSQISSDQWMPPRHIQQKVCVPDSILMCFWHKACIQQWGKRRKIIIISIMTTKSGAIETVMYGSYFVAVVCVHPSIESKVLSAAAYHRCPTLTCICKFWQKIDFPLKPFPVTSHRSSMGILYLRTMKMQICHIRISNGKWHCSRW